MKPARILLCALALHLPLSAAPPARRPPPAPSAGTLTTSRFGNGTITRGTSGKTWTTTRFGNGTITRGSDGSTWTTTRFGNGALSRGTGAPPPVPPAQPRK